MIYRSICSTHINLKLNFRQFFYRNFHYMFTLATKLLASTVNIHQLFIGMYVWDSEQTQLYGLHWNVCLHSCARLTGREKPSALIRKDRLLLLQVFFLHELKFKYSHDGG